MSSVESEVPVNSRQWWESYFGKQWSENNGRVQTTRFMESLVHNLPAPEQQYLLTHSSTVLDWGCACGDGVAVLGKAFPHCHVTGLDFAEAAIAEARQSFQQHEFLHIADGEPDREFDVIITSNCLEHFDHPLDVVKSHLHWCRDFYVALVPYREAPLIDCHKAQFREECFPQLIEGFTRICAQPIDVDQSVWTGQQLLVVYASAKYLAQRAAATTITHVSDSWPAEFEGGLAAGLAAAVSDFAPELAAAVREVLPEGARVLVVGARYGMRLAEEFATGFHVTLMDASEESRNRACRRLAATHPNINFVQGDIRVAGSAEFDLVLATSLLERSEVDQGVALARGMTSRSRRYVMALAPNGSCHWYWVWQLAASRSAPGIDEPQAAMHPLSMFESSGVRSVGYRFGGAAGTETLINDLTGMHRTLREKVVTLHDSAMVPACQKGLLVATLGSNAKTDAPFRQWNQPETVQAAGASELGASLAAALSLGLAAEQRAQRTQSRLEACESRLRTVLCASTAAPPWFQQALEQKGHECQELRSELANARECLAAIERSRSWRLTRPLRDASGLVRRIDGYPRTAARRIINLSRRGLKTAVRHLGKTFLAVAPESLTRRAKVWVRDHVPDRVWRGIKSVIRADRTAGNDQSAIVGQRLEAFLADAAANHADKLFLIVSGTTFTTSEGQRPTRLAREMAKSGIPVLFCYWRWDVNEPLRPQSAANVLEVPFDWLVAQHDRLLNALVVATWQRALLIEFPHAGLVEIINKANALGWRTVYDIIDDWHEFHQAGQAIWYDRDVERYVASNVDAVTVTCPTLATKDFLSGVHKILLVPNALEDWPRLPPATSASKQSARNVTIGYFGHLTPSWFDWELVKATAEDHPDWRFEIIGYGLEGSIRLPANVHLLGKVEHHRLPDYASQWDVAIIPFRPSRLAAAVDPIKVYEYIALGLPTVVTGMPHLSTYPGVRCANDAAAFASAITVAARERPAAADVEAFLARNRWSHRVDVFLEILQKREHLGALGRAVAETRNCPLAA